MKRILQVAGAVVLASVFAVGFAMIPGKKVEAAGDIAIDETNFPDDNFRKCVLAKADTNQDKKLSEAEIANVMALDVFGENIASLKGIEYFTALTKLICSENQLTSLDVSKNTELVELACFNNQLASLDLRKNTKLERLFCFANQLTSLDLNKNTNLVQVNCGVNQLTSLNISKLTKLNIVVCFDNKLTSLDVSKSRQLEHLECYYNEIKEINIKDNECISDAYSGATPKTSQYKGKDFCSYTLNPSTDKFYLFEFDDGVKIWTAQDQPTPTPTPTPTPIPLPNSVCIEMDLSEGPIPYSGSNDQFTALATLLQKDEKHELIVGELDSENQILYLDLDRDGNYDVDFLLLGNIFLRKSASCNIETEIVFTEDQLQDTIYKEIAFVFGERCTVSFDANGGSGAMEPQKVFVVEEFILPECEFTAPKGKEFDGWNLGKPGDSVKIAVDTVIKAQWKEIIYSVKVTTDGNGTASASVKNGATGTEVTLTAKPNDGYKFKKWQVLSGGVKIKDNKFTIGKEDVEIKAVFQALSAKPTKAPTKSATPTPTLTSTPVPTKNPTKSPTKSPTKTPSKAPTKAPTKVPTKTPTKAPRVTPTPTKAPVFSDFVERLYTCALNRKSEPEGKKYWTDEVTSGRRTGGDCARYFLLEAPEFMNRNLSVEDFVETLYKTFFDRASDAAGKQGWVKAIQSGAMSHAEVVENFIESTEWCNICAKYSVKSGAKYHKATIASPNAISFATRLYTCCLGRDPEEGGLNFWSLALTNLEKTGAEAAQLFFESQEFVDLRLDDKEYITRLYTTFMDRQPEDGGMQYWLGEMAKGKTRRAVMAWFAESPEFTSICAQYGIDRGSIA